MSRPLIAAWLLVITGAPACIGSFSLRVLHARSHALRAESDLHLVVHQARELAALDAQQSAPSPRPASGLAPRITAALARCGLPASSLSSFTPDAQMTPVGSTGLVRQRAGLTLNALTLPQLGAFLDAWRRSDPAWTVTSIDIAPGNGRAATPGGDLPLQVVLSIETSFAQDAGSAPIRPGGTR